MSDTVTATTPAVTATTPTAVTANYLNINEASKACGLSPSVLRIWELRYGWPCPKRKPNGYRAYSPYLVEDLKRMARLVKNGASIREMITDGLPQWPEEIIAPRPRAVEYIKTIPTPKAREMRSLHADLVSAIERRQTGIVRSILDRVSWQIRPDGEAITALVPALIGIDELNAVGRDIGEDDAAIRNWIRNRAMQLLRRCEVSSGRPFVVVPTSESEIALACVITLILNQRGIGAKAWIDGDKVKSKRVLLAGPDECDIESPIARITSLPTDDAHTLVEIIESGSKLPWQK